MICLLVLTDGRDHLLERTLDSAREHLEGEITRTVIHTDVSTEHVPALAQRYPNAEIIGGDRLGFGGAIGRAWKVLAAGRERFVFHLEDDFTFNRPVSLTDMAAVLDAFPHVAQMALRRQPWNETEAAAGGIVECWPEMYEDVEWEGLEFLMHRLFFTTNPSLYRRELCERGWPVGPRSERAFSDRLFCDQQARSAFWGSRTSGEWVHHIGGDRVGTGY